MKYLHNISSPKDLQAIDFLNLPEVCKELRAYIVKTILENGGHFAANLGVIELTVALHYQLDLPKDNLIWDVGHQSYAHKVLTGRRDQLKKIRKTGGIAGFPSIFESVYDTFGTGHSSTSLSALAGIAKANHLSGTQSKNVAVIGDGALTAGQAFEALNHIAELNSNVLIVVNDNQMSIDANRGNLGRVLANTKKAKLYFETLGFHYQFCEKGNNFSHVFKAIEKSLKLVGPRILHVKTKKGFGFQEAEQDHIRWHATESKVKILPKKAPITDFPKFQEVAGATMVKLGKKDEKVVVVTPAMPTGSGLKEFESLFPDRFFDVGIAEQHAITFCAGLAKQGYKVYCFIYSTFLQRGYDQLIHDVCLQKLPVVFCIDRAGLVGGDGATHHGAFDMAFLQPIPNIVIQAPSTLSELQESLFRAKETKGPLAIRYPRGRGKEVLKQTESAVIPPFKIIQQGKVLGIISIGATYHTVKSAMKLLEEKYKISWLQLYQVKPLPMKEIQSFSEKLKVVITVEDGVVKGGIGSQIASSLNINNRIIPLGVQDHFVEHGDIEDLKKQEGFDAESLAMLIREWF